MRLLFLFVCLYIQPYNDIHMHLACDQVQTLKSVLYSKCKLVKDRTIAFLVAHSYHYNYFRMSYNDGYKLQPCPTCRVYLSYHVVLV